LLRGFVPMAVKEFRQVLRDRVTIVIAVLIPVIQIIIFGYAIRTDVTNVTCIIADLSQSELSRKLVTALENTGVFRIRQAVLSYGDAHDLIRNGKAKVAVIIPPDFSSRRATYESSQVQVLIDGSDSTVANYVLSTLDAVIRKMSEQALVKRRLKPRFVARPRVLFNPELKSATFFVPALIVLILHMPLIVLTSLSIVRERAEGTLEQLIVTPIGRLGLMLGKLVPFFCIGTISGVGVLLVMVYVFNVPVLGSLSMLTVVLLLWVLTSLSLGLMLSTIAKTQIQAVLMAILVVVPSILLSGFIFPRESMPVVVYPITLLIPMTYAVNIVRGLVIRGADAGAILPDFGVLIGITIFLLTMSTVRFQKKLQ